MEDAKGQSMRHGTPEASLSYQTGDHKEHAEYYGPVLDDEHALGNVIDEQPVKAKISLVQGGIVFFKSCFGVGILGMPFAFRNSGVTAGIVACIVVALTTNIATKLLVWTKREMAKIHGEHVASIPHIAAVVSPGSGERWANLVVILCQLGTCIAYNIFLGVSFTAIVEELYPTHNYAEMKRRGYNPYVFFVLCNSMLFCLLVQFKDFARMAPLLIFAQGAMMTAMALVIAHGLIHPSVCDRDADTLVFCRVHWEARWQTFPIFVGIAVFAMEGIPTILAIEDSLERPELFERMFDITQALVTVVFIGFGVMGYWLYGDNTRSVITLNIHGLWGISVKMLMVVVIFFSYPLQFFPVAQILSKISDRLASSSFGRKWSAALGVSEEGDARGRRDGGKSSKGEVPDELSDRILSIFKILGVVTTGLVALCVPHFGHVLSILGSVTFSAITYLIPPILYLKARQGSHRFQMVILCFVLILFGLSITVVGLWSNFVSTDVWKHEIEKAPPRAGSSEALQAHHIYQQAEGLIKKSSAEADKLEDEERRKWSSKHKGEDAENSWTKQAKENWKGKWMLHPKQVPVNQINQDKTFYKTAESVGTMEGLVKKQQWKKFVPWHKVANAAHNSSIASPPPQRPLPPPSAPVHPLQSASAHKADQGQHKRWSHADSYAIRRLQKSWNIQRGQASPRTTASSPASQVSARKSLPPPLSGKEWQVPKLIFHGRAGAKKTREELKKEALRKLLRMKAQSRSMTRKSSPAQ